MQADSKKAQKYFRQIRRREDVEKRNIKDNDGGVRKRNVDEMEIESDLGMSKKARMEIDGDEENEDTNKFEAGNAGLQGQPGGPK